jgi:hypothetical protein
LPYIITVTARGDLYPSSLILTSLQMVVAGCVEKPSEYRKIQEIPGSFQEADCVLHPSQDLTASNQ